MLKNSEKKVPKVAVEGIENKLFIGTEENSVKNKNFLIKDLVQVFVQEEIQVSL